MVQGGVDQQQQQRERLAAAGSVQQWWQGCYTAAAAAAAAAAANHNPTPHMLSQPQTAMFTGVGFDGAAARRTVRMQRITTLGTQAAETAVSAGSAVRRPSTRHNHGRMC
ncbi:MAG: hypothetical protein WDW36_005751 [Sanguina aurantia]